jgi:hypothetical protein
MLTTTKDMTACLTNCSNNGVCALDSNRNFICKCFQFYGGAMCERDLRPCSSFPCMRNGTCNNIINSTNNLTTYDFECKCQFPYYGRYCQLITDLCWNITCSKQGHCFMNDTKTYCKCYTSFSGENCEIVSDDLQTKRTIAFVSACVAITIICVFFGSIVFLDVTKYWIPIKNALFPNKISPKKIIKKKPKIAFEKTVDTKPSTSKSLDKIPEEKVTYIEAEEDEIIGQQAQPYNKLKQPIIKDKREDVLINFLKESQSSNGKTFVTSVLKNELPK